MRTKQTRNEIWVKHALSLKATADEPWQQGKLDKERKISQNGKEYKSISGKSNVQTLPFQNTIEN